MNKIIWIFIIFGAISCAEPISAQSTQLTLDTITFQLSAKQWLSTTTALLKININVSLANSDLNKARINIMEQLGNICAGEWHLTQFERSTDSSGLEKLYVQAQVRTDQTTLASVYQKTRAISKPGASYEISSIEFSPSLAEIEKIRQQLRENLYQQTHDELVSLNKIYKNQNFSLNSLVFIDGNDINPAPIKAYKTQEASSNNSSSEVLAPTLSNEIIMSANVQVASNRICAASS